MKINSINFRERREYKSLTNSSPAHYQLVDVDFEIGNRSFLYSFAIFAETELEAIPKIKKEVGNYLVNQLFKGYDAINKLKE